MLRLDINLLFTVINLLIWYLIIKKFLFKPVNNIIAKREATINGHYKEAETAKAEADQQKEKYEALQNDIQEEKSQMMQKAQEDARAAYQQIVEEANKEAGQIIENSKKAAELEHSKMLSRAETEIRSLLFSSASENLQKEADNSALYDKFLAKAGDGEHAES